MTSSEQEQSGRPLWVRLGLWGVPTRRIAVAFALVSAGAAFACALYGFVDKRFWAGVVLVASALWYWSAIRWMDKHGRGTWPKSRRDEPTIAH